MKKIILIGLFAAFCHVSSAQEGKKKPDCNKPKESCSIKDKKACSPGDTKISEAKVLTEMRKQLSDLSNSFGYDEEIERGKNDDESLTILLTRINAILKEEGLPELAMESSKSRMVAAINSTIAELKSQVK